MTVLSSHFLLNEFREYNENLQPLINQEEGPGAKITSFRPLIRIAFEFHLKAFRSFD